ncbi:MAG: DUF6526 family protein [Gemmatimonadota bacterium]|nr:DUF6526 family protein [Gemmatimonadota bacterium]
MTRPAQTFANHARWFPLYHFFVLPATIANIIGAAFHAVRHPSAWNWWNVVMAVAICGLALAARVMALTVQDRLIRLEMRMRFAALLPPDQAAEAGQLPVRRLVELRFAGDAELPGLVARCLAGELGGRNEIKRAIRDWQADWVRA